MLNMQYRSAFLREISLRGYVKQCSDFEALDDYLCNNKDASMYIGFDCTAESLHIGSLMSLMLLRIWQRCGHTPIILIGGGTTKIGDPSGKDATRKMLSAEDIERNARGIESCVKGLFDYDCANKPIFVNNAEWVDGLHYIDFLRDYGRHFSVNRMLKFESVDRRIKRNQELSFIEFNYLLIQAYDFQYLYKKYNCRLQCGGSDQWGNIVSGIELNRRLGQGSAFGLTTPLILDASGKKMGKTADGQAIWLNKTMTDPYDYWQYFRNVDDSVVESWLAWFTDLNEEDLAACKQRMAAGEINEVKKILATEATAICHGRDVADSILNKAVKAFEGGSEEAFPELEISRDIIGEGIGVKQLICQASILPSTSEAKRMIKSGGVVIAGERVVDENLTIVSSMFPLSIAVGKKRKFRLVLSDK